MLPDIRGFSLSFSFFQAGRSAEALRTAPTMVEGPSSPLYISLPRSSIMPGPGGHSCGLTPKRPQRRPRKAMLKVSVLLYSGRNRANKNLDMCFSMNCQFAICSTCGTFKYQHWGHFLGITWTIKASYGKSMMNPRDSKSSYRCTLALGSYVALQLNASATVCLMVYISKT